MKSLRWLGLSCAWLVLGGCIKKGQGGVSAADAEPLSVQFSGNPFAGVQLYVAPYTVNDGSPLDAYVWLKNPGESDGECNGGPAAGQWFHERAIEMARNAAW